MVERSLEPFGEPGLSRVPFNYDGQVLGSLREDQIPRFLGALTDTESLPTADFHLSSLYGTQNRVSTSKVEAIRASDDTSGKKPLIVIHNGKNYIADGHHRAAAQWLNGDEFLEAHYKDVSSVDNAVKMFKSGDEMRLAFGFASVTLKDGETVVDTQLDTIDDLEILRATTDFMEKSRAGKMMHVGGKVGEVVHSFPLTPEIAKSLGISTSQYGWIVGMKVHSDSVWELVKSGKLQSFSIGGNATRVSIE